MISYINLFLLTLVTENKLSKLDFFAKVKNMNFSSISDLHIRSCRDESYRVLLSFMEHEMVKKSDSIIFAGDIFDLMCGDHPEYLQKFPAFFENLINFLREGKKIYYIEGNHDLHLKNLFHRSMKDLNPDQRNLFKLTSGFFEIDMNNKKVFISHGDEYDFDNITYQRYKKFVLSKPLALVANYLMPLRLLDYLGYRAADQSRKRGNKSFNPEAVRLKTRKGLMMKSREADIVIGGHTHVLDLFEIEDQRFYFNNGYPPKDKKFIHFNGHKCDFISLTI